MGNGRSVSAENIRNQSAEFSGHSICTERHTGHTFDNNYQTIRDIQQNPEGCCDFCLFLCDQSCAVEFVLYGRSAHRINVKRSNFITKLIAGQTANINNNKTCNGAGAHTIVPRSLSDGN